MRPLNRGQAKNLGAKATDADEAMNALVRLVAARERSVQETNKRLLEKGYSQDATSSAVERALSCGLLDDQRFAKDLIKDRLAAGWGRRRIESDLYRFGINKGEVEGYPEAFFSDDEQLEQALLILKCHRTRSKNPRQAAYQYLVSKGYSSNVASIAVRKQLEEA